MTKVLRRLFVFLMIAWTAGVFAVPQALAGDSTGKLTDPELSTLVQRAYVYGFPVYEMYRIRYRVLYNPKNPQRLDVNMLGHARQLLDYKTQTVTAPNNDTLYSIAWLNLSEEPQVLSVPDTGGRYYSIALMDFYTNNFAYVGRRVTGARKGYYLIAGPNWKGSIPTGLALIKSPTNAVCLLGRTLVDGKDDLSNVYEIQDQFKLASLSRWFNDDTAGVNASPAAAVPPAPDSKDPWNFWKIVNLGLTENPPPADERPLMKEFEKIGIGPGQVFDPGRFSAAQTRVVLRAMEDAAAEIKIPQMRYGTKLREGWSYPNPALGNFGKDYDYRAFIALVGLLALEPAEATYVSADLDRDGKELTGNARYRLHFQKEHIPPVDAFWSLTLYEVMPDGRAFFTANPINRYSIGDRTKGLKYNKDGSLDIYLQRESPGRNLESNWLPAPAGRFRLSLRLYQPRESILQGTYKVPGVQRLD